MRELQLKKSIKLMFYNRSSQNRENDTDERSPKTCTPHFYTLFIKWALKRKLVNGSSVIYNLAVRQLLKNILN